MGTGLKHRTIYLKSQGLFISTLPPLPSVLATDTLGYIPTEKEQRTTLFTESQAIYMSGISLYTL